jgi:nucleoporin GLE1
MTGPEPPRRGVQFSSPERAHVVTYLSDNRNNELTHQEALAASKAEHDRVRENALRVIEIHTLQLEQLRLEEKESLIRERQKKEHERLEREKRLRAEEQRLRDLEAQQVPELPPKPKSQEPPAKPAPSAVNGASQSSISTQPAATTAAASKPGLFDTSKDSPASTPLGEQINGASKVDAKPAASPFGTLQPSVPATSSPFAKLPATTLASTTNPFGEPAPAANPFVKPAPTLMSNGVASVPVQAAPVQAAPVQAQPPPAADRYVQIHQNLKKLRAMIKEQMTTNIDLKKNAGNMRREIRKSIGQLTSEKGANRDKVYCTTRESM